MAAIVPEHLAVSSRLRVRQDSPLRKEFSQRQIRQTCQGPPWSEGLGYRAGQPGVTK